MAAQDFKRVFKSLYQAPTQQVVEVDVPALKFLMVDGQGDPNTTSAYAEAVEALFSVSYAAKFLLKRGPQGLDYGVMPLEGLWWADDPEVFLSNDRSAWRWTMMIMQPPCVGDEVLQAAIAQVRAKKALPGLAGLRAEAFTEGRCAQTLHVGPFSAEGPTIQRVHDHITAHGQLGGKHHEIYLSDIRRAAPEKWRTIIRQPLA
jgi:hypothetical protein